MRDGQRWNRKEPTRRARPAVAILVAIILLTFAIPALATQVSAPCGGLGYFQSYGTANGWQQHAKSGYVTVLYTYQGVQSRTRSYGWLSGTQFANVTGNQLSSAGARCPN